MRVLILGGTGVISTGLTRLLLERGDAVTLFNRGRTSATLPAGAELLRGERGAADDLARAASGDFDAVIDMICFTPLEATLAAAAFARQVPHFIMCSTIDVYTAPARRYPLTEEHPRQPIPAFRYAHDKAEAERILRDAEAAGAFGLTILRPAATYVRGIVAPIGPAALYLDLLWRQRPLVMPGDGYGLWVATHRDDVARGFMGALDNPKAVGRDYNLASDEFITWEEYWRIAADAIGAPPPRFVHIPTELIVSALPVLAEWCGLNFQFHNLIDSSAARRDLGFAPVIPWSEGAKALRDGLGAPDPAHVAQYEGLLARWDAALAAFRQGG